jgi:rhodanese-related sulfurtransferase
MPENDKKEEAMNRCVMGVLVLALCVLFIGHGYLYAEETQGGKQDMFTQLFTTVSPKDGVKEISYEQFKMIRDSGEKYILLDVLSSESYNSGHIESAFSFPFDTINEENTKASLAKDANIIVYCGGFKCLASTAAAKKLSELGYRALDYKGGLEEWQQKGNALVK